MRKIINSATAQYEPVSTDNLVLDDRPISGSFNGITSDAVYKAISVDPGNVPAVESTDDGKVLTASYGAGGGSFAWATPEAPQSDIPEYSSTEVGKVLGVVADYDNVTNGQPSTILDWVDQPANELPAQLGTAGQVLTVNNSATGVEWATPSGGGSDTDFTLVYNTDPVFSELISAVQNGKRIECIIPYSSFTGVPTDYDRYTAGKIRMPLASTTYYDGEYFFKFYLYDGIDQWSLELSYSNDHLEFTWGTPKITKGAPTTPIYQS